MYPGESLAIVNGTKNQQSGFTGFYRDLENTLPSSATHYYPWNNELYHFLTSEAGYAVKSSTAESPTLTTLKDVSVSVVDCISHGAGVTLGLHSKNTDHAVTLWGADYDTATGMLQGVWLTDSDDNRAGGELANQDLFYASIGTATYTYNLSGVVDGVEKQWTEEREYLTLSTECGWLQDAQIQEFLFFNTAVSDLWGLKSVPEPGTATLSLLALAGLAARRRR